MEIDYRIENCLSYGYPEKEKYDKLKCDICSREIYEGEDYFDFFGERVCEECQFDYVLKNFKRCV